jgi:hypothetical protein
MAVGSAALAAAPPLSRAPPTDAVIHDIVDDNEHEKIKFSMYDAKQRALLASFESLPWDADRRHALAVETQARSDVLAMSRA